MASTPFNAMDSRELFESKRTTAGDAVGHIPTGSRVVVGHSCGAPEVLLKALVDARESYRDLEKELARNHFS
jgi:4-hydroxybutyrate CoA-transferase